MKKSILIVASSLAMGGLEKSLINLCDNIDYEKYEVDLYLFNEGRDLLPNLNKNVNLLPDSPLYSTVYNLPFLKSVKTLIKRKKFGLAIYRIKRVIKARFHLNKFSLSDWRNMKKTMLKIDKHYDAAIGFEEGSSDYFVTECVKADVKSVWIHTDIKAIDNNKKLDKKTFNAADYVCTVSYNSKKSLVDLYPEIENKIKVFNMPSLYDLDKIEEMATEPIEIEKGDFTVVSVGRLVELKGFHLCVGACAKLIEDGYKVKWYVCGDGDYRSNIEEEIRKYNIKDCFILLGNCANPYKYINAADLCVQASSYEGYPFCVYEEKLLKKAVVVSDIPSHREMITDGVNGIIVNRNSEDIYFGVKRLMNDRKLLEKAAANPVNNYKSKEETIRDFIETLEINE